MEATIVKLGPSDKLVGVCTFEEAFGEHSELRGRGRARRQKRRMKRISDRAERKRARQSMRKEQQAARQDRKDIRKTRKVARKAMGDEEDGEEDPNSVDQQDQVQPDESTQTSYSDTSYEDQGSDDQGSDDSEEGPEPYDFETGESGADGEDYAEARGGRRGAARRSARRAKRQEKRAARKAPAVEEAEEVAEEEMESSIDGDFMDGENLSAATGAKPVQRIHPQIKDHTKRIVWNREALRRHRANHARYSNEYKQKMQMPAYRAKPNHPHVVGLREAIQRHDMEIQKHEERLAALERTLAEKFSGHPHIEHGYKLANIELQKQIEGTRTNQTQATIKDTLVDKGLGADIETNRIDVPAQPEMRTIELSSNASGDAGKGMSTPTKLLIGAAALGLAYYFAKKYKVI